MRAVVALGRWGASLLRPHNPEAEIDIKSVL